MHAPKAHIVVFHWACESQGAVGGGQESHGELKRGVESCQSSLCLALVVPTFLFRERKRTSDYRIWASSLGRTLCGLQTYCKTSKSRVLDWRRDRPTICCLPLANSLHVCSINQPLSLTRSHCDPLAHAHVYPRTLTHARAHTHCGLPMCGLPKEICAANDSRQLQPH
jgi:hypothetical protein